MSKFITVRTEQEVGILYRITNDVRFEGVFKGRYSDFHVNEIDLNGKIVQLTSLDPPPESKSDVPEHDPQIYSWIPEDVRKSIGGFQEKLVQSVQKGSTKSDPVWKEKIEIQVRNFCVKRDCRKVTNLGKEERTKIHKWLGNFDKLHSETVERDGEKYIVVLHDNKNNRNRRRPANRPKYTHCTMYKEGVDTSEAIGVLSKKLRIKPNFITYCGTKDKFGKTTQRICISNIDAHRLAQISRETRSIKLGNYEYLPHHLRLGDLKGNHFKILLRNVTAISDEYIATTVESLKASGFINYFGMQRFGSYKISTHSIGKSILQNSWIEAFDLILTPKSNDPDFMVKAKECWFRDRDPNEAIKKLPHWHRSIESSLLHGLAKYYTKNDYIGVFLRLPRNVRHLYIHSFQSYLWNQVASYRIKELGSEPVVGDVVYENEEHEDFFFEDEEHQVFDDDNDDSTSCNETSDLHLLARKAKVKTLTAEDLPNHTIFDVLLPIQGTQITIPDNYIKKFYNKLLDEQGIDQDCFLKFKPLADQPKGAYRKLCVRPQNVSHKIVAYNDSDPVDTFIPSEIDKLTVPAGHNHAIGRTNVKYDDEIKVKNVNESENPNIDSTACVLKDKKCVILEISLPSSSYATMALREIMVSNAEGTDNDKHEANIIAKRNIEESSNNDLESKDSEPKKRKMDS